eukprot:NODE_28777_length_466_cov_2.811209.p2 GENE.NODE_28777_length_466_cov_2.811209~~NODE_28777_length_466_cov_2.811209.p2  ORF type:complete len:56 (-),score=40.68 NODE_28777_length_466_cov_2.811209:96-263(-)
MSRPGIFCKWGSMIHDVCGSLSLKKKKKKKKKNIHKKKKKKKKNKNMHNIKKIDK